MTSRDRTDSHHPTPCEDERFWARLCADPALLEAFREDPEGAARAAGVRLSARALAEMRGLETDAVPDVVLDPAPPDTKDLAADFFEAAPSRG